MRKMLCIFLFVVLSLGMLSCTVVRTSVCKDIQIIRVESLDNFYLVTYVDGTGKIRVMKVNK